MEPPGIPFIEWLQLQRKRRDRVGFLARQIEDYPELLKAAEQPLDEVEAMNAIGVHGEFVDGFREAVAEWIALPNP